MLFAQREPPSPEEGDSAGNERVSSLTLVILSHANLAKRFHER